jgi:RNA polymerase sigma-70 factor (ECF subfamily)
LEQFLDDGHHARPVRPWSVAPDAALEKRETAELIGQAIDHLPETYRDIYVLADVEGLPNGEIAELLDLSVPAVKSRLHRSRLMMRNALAPHFEEVAS